MPRESPYKIVLSGEEARELSRRAAKYMLPYFIVIRAKMILLAAKGHSNDAIAKQLNTCREVVSMWRKRFFEERLQGLEERPRLGRPRFFPP
ncbi:MAG: helix-turn-helix domain-containing protein [Deltaproteobacteria bacterium]|nr:helix-turn-helix domain-containing protein [Deltaproteobacteria bacterium]